MSIYSLQDWKIFERLPNAEAIAAGLKDIPAHWSLTPLQDKSPRRDNWQTEPFIPHSTIEDLILRGNEGVSKKTGKPYYRYWSGFGLRTGEASGGLLAIDVDGESAQPLLEAISFHDIPTTVSWTSGKPGRYQLLFQIPDEIREPLEQFNRTVVTEWGGLQTARDAEGKPTELLEFRYNGSQSCLPPSRHPTTGAYHWINSPADVEVALAPVWLCELLIKLASTEKQQLEAKAEKQRQIEEKKQQRLATGFVGSTNLEDVIEQAERRLTPDEAFNWTGHNWKHQGRREWIGYCPRHQSKSGTAFHVNPNTLEWFCHGCNEGGSLVQYRWFVRGGNGTPRGKDFVDVCKEIAEDAGIEMPAFTQRDYTTSRQKLDRPITRDEWEVKFGFGRWLGQTITSILGKPKGFGNKKPERCQASQTSMPPEIIRYPQDPLPRPEDYEGRDLPRIIFKKRKRLEVLAKLKQLGWKFVCDRSFTGSGKSHEAGLLNPDENAANKIWYFDQNHTNPSTETIETMSNMPPRHNGMVMVPGKFTPLGYPVVKWDSGEFGEDAPRIPSLCHNADLFIGLKSRGWDIDSQQNSIQSEDGESVSRNPICKQCRFAFKCHKEIGEGYGYLAMRREIMETCRIRASLDSAPSPKRRKYSPEEGEKKYDYSNDIAFVEEASRYLKGTKTLSALASELAELWQYVERKTPEAHAVLQPIRFVLQDAFNGDFDCIEKGVNWGADHETLINEFPRRDSIANLPNQIEQVKAAMPTIQEVIEEPDSVTGLGGKWRSAGQFVRDIMKSQAAHQTKQNIENLPPNVLVDVLEILAGLKPGSFRVQGKQLHVTVQDTRHADILRTCKFVVLLDATPNTQYLEKILGDRILEIEEERPPLTNLTVVNVNMKGMGSRKVSDTCKARQVAFLDWFKQQHPEGKALTYKGDYSYLLLAGHSLDGHWHHDNRGSNAFKGVEALAAFGTPRTNLGAAQDKYRALFGSLEGFEDYYQDLVEAEIIQLVGRQRAHMYPDKQFTLYLISTNQDLSYLEALGCKLINKEAFELTPLAGTPKQITVGKLMQAFGQLQDQGEKITQEAIAALIGKSQEFISKFAKNLGGWPALKKLLLSLLNTYRTSNNFGELNEEARFLAESYLPLMLDTPEEAPESLSDIVSAYGLPTVLKGVKALAPQLQARMLSCLLQHLAPSTPQETPSEILLPSLYSLNRDGYNFEPTPPVTISVDSEPTEAGMEPAGSDFLSLEENPGDDAGTIYDKDMVEVPPEEPAPAPTPNKLLAWVGNIPIIIPKKVAAVAAAAPVSQQNPVEISQPLVREYHWEELPNEDVATENLRPPLSAYQEGDEVWAYFPQSMDKWLKATVEWVRGNTIRVVSGFFGMFIERPDMIAPGDWVLEG